MSDVAAIQAAFRDIEDSRALLLAVFVHTPLGMALYDRDGWAIADNPAHRTMFGPRPPGRYNLLQDPRVDASGQRRLIERGLAGEAVTLPPYVSTNRVDGRPLQYVWGLPAGWVPVMNRLHADLVELLGHYEVTTVGNKLSYLRVSLDMSRLF